MATHAMTAVDAAWYHIDGPVNFAQVTAILLTREPLDFERVRSVCRARLARFDRFSRRVAERALPGLTPRWEDMPGFDIGQQVHHIALPEPRDHAALVTLISDLASTPLDRTRPLWDAHVVDDVDGGSALIMRLHHCIGDGTAAMVVCQALFDETRRVPAMPPSRTRKPRNATGLADQLLVPALTMIARPARAIVSGIGATVGAVVHPEQLLAQASLALDGAAMLFAELRKRPDPASPLKGRFGLEKRVAWSDPVRLVDVKAIGRLADAKINDVLVACMTGALRHYLRKRGIDVRQTTVRAMVPVDLRPPERAGELGNDFGLVILELAVARRTAAERLRLTKARMDALKRSPEPVAILALFNLFGRTPKAFQDMAVDLFGSKASAVMTNVVGPPRALYLAGVPIDRIMFWVPHPGRQLGMGISIMSYKGEATLSVIADAHLVPDPEMIAAGFNREFARMLKAARRNNGKAKNPARTAPRAPVPRTP